MPSPTKPGSSIRLNGTIQLDALVELEAGSRVSIMGVVCEISSIEISDQDPTPKIKLRIVNYLP